MRKNLLLGSLFSLLMAYPAVSSAEQVSIGVPSLLTEDASAFNESAWTIEDLQGTNAQWKYQKIGDNIFMRTNRSGSGSQGRNDWMITKEPILMNTGVTYNGTIDRFQSVFNMGDEARLLIMVSKAGGTAADFDKDKAVFVYNHTYGMTSNNVWFTEQFTFSVDSPGAYYIAICADTPNLNAGNYGDQGVKNFDIKCEESELVTEPFEPEVPEPDVPGDDVTGTIIYQSGMAYQTLEEGWTYEDANGDTYYWGPAQDLDLDSKKYSQLWPNFHGVYSSYTRSNGGDADDWLFSPAINLTAGKSYQISFDVVAEPFSDGQADESFGAYMGREATSAAMKQGTPFVREQNIKYTEYQTKTFTFTPEETAGYYFALHFDAPEYTWGLLAKDLVVMELGGEEEPEVPNTPGEDEEVTVVYSSGIAYLEMEPGWTTENTNGDQYRWGPASDLAIHSTSYTDKWPDFHGVYSWYTVSGTGDAEDWLFSPAISFTKGKSYEISFDIMPDLNSNGEADENYAAYMGKVATSEAMKQGNPYLNEEHLNDNTDYQHKSFIFTPEETAEYYFGLQFYAGNYTYGLLAKDLLVVELKGEEGDNGEGGENTGEEEEPAEPEYADIVSVFAPTTEFVEAGRTYDPENPEVRTGLGEIVLALSGDGEITLGEGAIELSCDGEVIYSWTAESPESDLMVDAANPVVYLNGVTGGMVLNQGFYSLDVPEGFFSKGNVKNNAFFYGFISSAVEVPYLVEFSPQFLNANGYCDALETLELTLAEGYESIVAMPMTFFLTLEDEEGNILAEFTECTEDYKFALAEKIEKAGKYTATLFGSSLAFSKAAKDSAEAWYSFNELVQETWEVNANVGVDTLLGEESEAEYYNMQGIRVANPQEGLYIRRQGGEAQRILKR